MKQILLFFFSSFLLSAQAQFTKGNLAVLRAGDNVSSITSAATSVTVVEYTTAGATTGISYSIPSTTAGSRMVISGTQAFDGTLSRSVDGRYLLFGGYDAAIGTASSTAQAATKVIGRMAYDGTLDMTTKLTAPGGVAASIRRVASYNGSNIYSCISSAAAIGITYQPLGSTTYTDINTANYRGVYIFEDQLYAASGGNVLPIGTGLPTSSATAGSAIITSGASGNGIVMFNLSNTEPGMDVAYLADQTGTTSGLRKFCKIGGVWTSTGVLDISAYPNPNALATAANLYDLAGEINLSGNAVLYSCRGNSGNNYLVSIEDPSGYGNNLSAGSAIYTQLATAGTSRFIFKGVSLAPTQFSILPLRFLSFTGTLKNNTANLQWKTTNEVNVKGFSIERSNNGQDFIPIGSVSAANVSGDNRYSFDDKGATAKRLYYRLKQLDLDGRFSYSTVVILRNTGEDKGVELFPNPVGNNTVLLHPKAGKVAEYAIITTGGQIVLRKAIGDGATQTALDLSALTEGSYFIRFVNDGVATTLKFIR